MSENKTSYKLADLAYAFDALEPVISKEALLLHYEKHHKGYVEKLNMALDQYHDAEKKKDVKAMVALQSVIEFNGGGHVNHSFFWTCLCPQKQSSLVSGPLLKAIEENFSSLEKFQEIFLQEAQNIQGSGWCWLAFSEDTGHLEVITTQNHKTLTTMKKKLPLLVIDVWEHAYYLQYQNRKADFLQAIWSIINWKEIEQRYMNLSN